MTRNTYADLSIIQKTYDLTLDLYQCTRHFPRSERFTLAAQLRDTAYRMLALMVKANHSRKRLPILWEIDGLLQQHRILLRLARDIGILPFKQYARLFDGWVEIGKMLGGWMNATRQHQGRH